MNENAKAEFLRLLLEDDDTRRAILEALAKDLSGFADLMRRAHEIYPLKLRP